MIALLLAVALTTQTPPAPKEKEPKTFSDSGYHFPRPACGWNGDLQQDGKCHVRIVFSTDYPPVTCKVRKALPEEGHENEGQIVDCTWEPSNGK
jgi:hypothetical protein